MFDLEFLDIDKLSAILFVILMSVYLYYNRKNVGVQKILAIGKVPIIYFLLLRTKFGLKLMDKISSKFREAVKLFGYCSIGVGFVGMLLVSFLMLMSLLLLIFKPEVENGAALILPFTTIPGLGYLSFWHFIISLFIIAVIHEFAHGVVARAHDIKVKSSGTGAIGLIAPLLPLAFVEPDEEQIKEKPDIVQYSVFAAGPVINLVVGFLLYLLFIFVISPVGMGMFEENGFSFEVLNESYPAATSGLGDSEVIDALDGEPVDNFFDFSDRMRCVRPGETILIGTPKADYTITTTVSPDDENKGFIGIRPIENQVELKDEYKALSGPYFWFEGLIKWLFRLNLLVGIFNLLPVMIVDGGRMFQLAVNRILPNKKFADRIIMYMALFFLMIILLLLGKTYGTALLGLF